MRRVYEKYLELFMSAGRLTEVGGIPVNSNNGKGRELILLNAYGEVLWLYN